MKTKLMLGLAAVSLLASCGLIKTPQIVLQDTTKTVTPGSAVGGGALGIDGGKGAPLDLSKGGLVLQGTKTNVTIASGSFADLTNNDLISNLQRLSEWGATQTMPTATLSGTDCANIATFSVTGISFTLKIADPANTTGVSQTVNVPNLNFTRIGTTCDYNATFATTGSPAAIAVSIAGQSLTTFGTIITSGGLNTVTLSGSYSTSDTNLTGRNLVVNFGGSSSYIVATIL
jgi:hypothetical protein